MLDNASCIPEGRDEALFALHGGRHVTYLIALLQSQQPA
jgi:hypothetical protein